MKKIMFLIFFLHMVVPFCIGHEQSLGLIKDKSRKIILENAPETMSRFDPNYVKIETVYDHSANERFVQYKISFERSGLSAVNNIRVSCIMPEDFKLACKKSVHYFLDGQECKGKVLQAWNGKLEFTLTMDPDSIQCWNISSDLTCDGYILFCAFADNRLDLKYCNTDLRLIDPIVFFDERAIPITRFEDKLIYVDTDGSCYRDISDTNECNCKGNERIPFWLIIIGVIVVISLIAPIIAQISEG